MSGGLRAFVESLTGWLDTAAVPYMLAGSFASTLHGRPRSTQDVDFVIDPTLDTLRAFLAAVPQEGAYVDAKAATDALRARDMFNLIHLDTGWKADLIIRKSRAFSVCEFERRRIADWNGLPLSVASPEDVILSKLEWSRLSGGSERQLADVAGVVASVGAALDTDYIEKWLDVLQVRDAWAKVSDVD